MVIGICTLYLVLPSGSSLKEKRRVVNSIRDRIKSRYNVSVVEVDNHNSARQITIGIACVSNSSGHARKIMSNIIEFVGQNYIYETFDYEVEII
ncbi:TPA: DUF503 domain-containing protein [Candidatus Poribacteria bacterium]|nr:DUF503 domain-containing protein [Candidatus Poribacteria bacterium]